MVKALTESVPKCLKLNNRPRRVHDYSLSHPSGDEVGYGVAKPASSARFVKLRSPSLHLLAFKSFARLKPNSEQLACRNHRCAFVRNERASERRLATRDRPRDREDKPATVQRRGDLDAA
jgi:hypothetical protein